LSTSRICRWPICRATACAHGYVSSAPSPEPVPFGRVVLGHRRLSRPSTARLFVANHDERRQSWPQPQVDLNDITTALATVGLYASRNIVLLTNRLPKLV